MSPDPNNPNDWYLPVSLRFLVPEVDAAVGPDGLVVDVLARCYRSSVDVGGRALPYEFYFTSCGKSAANNYEQTIPWDAEPDRHCGDTEEADGSNPCGYSCAPRLQDLLRWREFLPAEWYYPELAGDVAGTGLAADDRHDLWWY